MFDTAITASLCFLRDDLRRQAQEILEPVLMELEAAKAKFHAAKIASNQLLKRAEKVQSQITVSMQHALDQQIQVEADYKVKSYSEMAELVIEKDASE